MVKKSWCAVLFLFLGWASLFAEEKVIQLAGGWNLVTVPVDSDTNIAEYLAANFQTGNSEKGNLSALKRIWCYDGGWTSYSPSPTGSNDLLQFKTNRGYWFYVTEASSIFVDTANFSLRPLELNTTGWAMVGFGNTESLSFKDDILHTDYIDEEHHPRNIRLVWSYSNNWKSYSSENSSGEATAIFGGGYWFYVSNYTDTENGTNYAVTSDNPITISPKGSDGVAALVIGGATELFPPDYAQVENSGTAAASRYTVASGSRYTVAGGSNPINNPNETNHCDKTTPANTANKIIGYAHAYSLNGEKLNNNQKSPVYCPDSAEKSLDYAVKFSKEEYASLKANPSLMKDMVVTVKLNTGAVEKTLVPAGITNAIAANTAEKPAPYALDTNADSTLNTALVGLEIARKLGVSPDRFKIGEEKSGLAELNSDIKSIVSAANPQIDIAALTGTVTAILQDESSESPLKALQNKIKEANNPANIAKSGSTFQDKTDEIADLLSGKSVPSYAVPSGRTESDIKAEIEKTRQAVSKVSDLISSVKRAEKAGIISASGASEAGKLTAAEQQKLTGLADNLLKDGHEAEVHLAEVLTRTIDMVRSTKDDTTLGNLTKNNLSRVLESVDTTKQKSTTQVMDLVAKAMDVPEEMVKTIAQNPEAARNFAGIVGTAGLVLDQARAEEQARSASGGTLELADASRLSSRLENSAQLINVLVTNAPDANTAQEIVAGAISSSAGARADASQKIMEQAQKSGVAIDLQEVAKKSVGQASDLKAVAQVLAAGSNNASDAAQVLAAVAASVTIEDMKTVVSSDKLKNEFSLNTRIIADAGRSRRVRYDGNQATFRLDAGNSFDPLAKTLYYRWFSIDKTTNDTSAIAGLSDWSANNISVEVTAENLTDTVKNTYRLEVAENTSGTRLARSEVEITFYPELPPVLALTQFVSAKKEESFILDASQSFDPEGEVENLNLHYEWDLLGLGTLGTHYTLLDGFTVNSPVLPLQVKTAGTYNVSLILKKSTESSTSVVQNVRLRIEDTLPPIADAGYDFILTSNEAKDGIQLDNFSYSREKGKSAFDDAHDMAFEWTPAYYFDNTEGNNSKSVNPLFKATSAGTYNIALKVTDSGKTASDSLQIIVKKGLPPVADAGSNTALRLPASGNIDFTLDGSRSFSYIGNASYRWSGQGLLSTNNTQVKPKVSLSSGSFNQRTTLRYTLTVTDENGESTASKEVVLIPSFQPPIIVLEKSPSRQEFQVGEQVKLDASFSFSPNSNGQIALFEWIMRSALTITPTYNDNNSLLTFTMPEVSEKTELKMQLKITDNTTLFATQDLSFIILPAKKPPVAQVTPNSIILEDKASDKNKVLLSASRSFSPHGHELTYRWEFNRKYFSLVSGTLTAANIELSAADGVDNREEVVTLHVTDTVNGLVAKTTVKARLIEKKDVEPLVVDLRFDQSFDVAKREFVPAYHAEQDIYLYEKGNQIRAFGFAYDPNIDDENDEVAVQVDLYQSNAARDKTEKIASSIDSGIGVITLSKISAAGFVDFNLQTPALGLADTYYLLVCTFGEGEGAEEHALHLKVKPDIQTVTTRPKAAAFVEKISSLNGSVSYQDSTTRLTETYADDFIEVYVNGAKSTPAVIGTKLGYEWSVDWDVSDPVVKAGYPSIFINDKNQSRANFKLPLSDTSRTLLVKLKVTDSYTGLTSTEEAKCYITASRKKAVPPIAVAGQYPSIWVPLKEGTTLGDNPTVTLNAGLSFSPVGNPLSFSWKSLNSSIDVVNANKQLASVTLPEGIHYFQLTVTDTVRDLIATASTQIEVKKEQLRSAGILYEIEAQVDISAVEITSEEPINLKGWVWAFSTDSAGLIEPNKIKTKITVKHQDQALASNEQTLTGGQGGQIYYSFATDNLGVYDITVQAWYDKNDDGLYNEGTTEDTDCSALFERSFTVRVLPKVYPVQFTLGLPAVPPISGTEKLSEFRTDLQFTSDPSDVVWHLTAFYGLFEKNQGLVCELTRKQEGLDSLYVDLVGEIEGGLAVGEYHLDIKLEAVAKHNGEEIARFYNYAFQDFTIQSSDLNIALSLINKTDEENIFDSMIVIVSALTADGWQELQTLAEFSIDSNKATINFQLELGDLEGDLELADIQALRLKVQAGEEGAIELENTYRPVPSSGLWQLDLDIVNTQVDIEGQYVRIGEFFSLSKGEVIQNRFDDTGAFRADIDLTIVKGGNSAPMFAIANGRRFVAISPVDKSGNVVTSPKEFFNRALQRNGNISFPLDIFADSLSGSVSPQEGGLYLVEYKKTDGSDNFALMLITMVDDSGFAFRFARATATMPEIKFTDAAVQEMVNLVLDPTSGKFMVSGGIPKENFKIETFASKPYKVETSSGIFTNIDADYWAIKTTTLTFSDKGDFSGQLHFNSDVLREGDYIVIESYVYKSLNGSDVTVKLPNPLYYYYHEPQAFSLLWTEKIDNTSFKVYFEGEPNESTLIAVNFQLSGADSLDAISNGQSVNIDSIDISTLEGGYFTLTHDESELEYLVFSASNLVLSIDQQPVARPEHIVTQEKIWGNLVKAPNNVTLQEIFADDYGNTSSPYLVKTFLIDGITFYKYNVWSSEPLAASPDWQEFYALKYGTDLEFIGEGELSQGVYNYYAQPQKHDDGYNPMTGQSSLDPLRILSSDWSVGSSIEKLFRVGNSYSTPYSDLDYRIIRQATVRVLRLLPKYVQRGLEYNRVVEVELSYQDGYAVYDAENNITDIDYYGEKGVKRYLIADDLGIIRQEKMTKNYDYVYRTRHTVVAYQKDGEVAVGAGGQASLFGADQKIEHVTVSVNLELPAGGASDYRLLVKKLDMSDNTWLDIAVGVSGDNYVDFSSNQVLLTLTSDTISNYTFILQKKGGDKGYEEIKHQEVKISGERGYEEFFISVPAEDDYPTRRLLRHEAFSFAAGQNMFAMDDHRDLAYLPRANSNEFELVVNDYLPDDLPMKDQPANRVLFPVTNITGADTKAKLKAILESSEEDITIPIQSGVNSVIPKSGDIYVYIGPDTPRLRTGAGGRIAVLFAVMRRDLEGLDLLYTVKRIGAADTKVSFKNSTLLNNDGYVLVEYGYSSRIQNASVLSAGENESVYYIYPQLTEEWYRSEVLGSGTDQLNYFNLHLSSAGYQITKGSFAKLVALPYFFEIQNMPTALHSELNDLEDLTSSNPYNQEKVFLAEDKQENHFIVAIRPMEPIGFGNYFIEYIYLSDGESLSKYVWSDNQLAAEAMSKHLLPYDFCFTYKPYHKENPALELVKFPSMNNFEIRPADWNQSELLRWAEVQIDIVFSPDVNKIVINGKDFERPEMTNNEYILTVELGNTGYSSSIYSYLFLESDGYVLIRTLRYQPWGRLDWIEVDYSDDESMIFKQKSEGGADCFSGWVSDVVAGEYFKMSSPLTTSEDVTNRKDLLVETSSEADFWITTQETFGPKIATTGDYEPGDDYSQAWQVITTIHLPGGYEFTTFGKYQLEDLPFALHHTLLPNEDSLTTLTFTEDYTIHYSYSEYDGNSGQWWHSCSAESVRPHVFHEHVLLIAKEQNGDNNFLFNPYHYASVEVDTDQQLCLTGSSFSFEYDYYDHTGTVTKLKTMAHAGDFAGTGSPHPLAEYDDLSEVLVSTSPDLTSVIELFNGFESLAAYMVSTGFDEYDKTAQRIFIRPILPTPPAHWDLMLYEQWGVYGSFRASLPTSTELSYSIWVESYDKWGFVASEDDTVPFAYLGSLVRSKYDPLAKAEIRAYPNASKDGGKFPYGQFAMTSIGVCYPFSRICGEEQTLADKQIDCTIPTPPVTPDSDSNLLPAREQLVPSFRINSITKGDGEGEVIVEFNRTPIGVTADAFQQVVSNSNNMPKTTAEAVGKFMVFHNPTFDLIHRLQEITEAYASTAAFELANPDLAPSSINWEERFTDFVNFINTDAERSNTTGCGGKSICGHEMSGQFWMATCEGDGGDCRRVKLSLNVGDYANLSLIKDNLLFFFFPMLQAEPSEVNDYYNNHLHGNVIGFYDKTIAEPTLDMPVLPELKISDLLPLSSGSKTLFVKVENFRSVGADLIVTRGNQQMILAEVLSEPREMFGGVSFGGFNVNNWNYGIPAELKHLPTSPEYAVKQLLWQELVSNPDPRQGSGPSSYWQETELCRFIVGEYTGKGYAFAIDSIGQEFDPSSWELRTKQWHISDNDFYPKNLLVPILVSADDYNDSASSSQFGKDYVTVGSAVQFSSIWKDEIENGFYRMDETISYRALLPRLVIQHQESDLSVIEKEFQNVLMVVRYGEEYPVTYDNTASGWVRDSRGIGNINEEYMFFATDYGVIMQIEKEIETTMNGFNNPGEGQGNPGEGQGNPGEGQGNPGDGSGTFPGDGQGNPGDGSGTFPGDGSGTFPGEGQGNQSFRRSANIEVVYALQVSSNPDGSWNADFLTSLTGSQNGPSPEPSHRITPPFGIAGLEKELISGKSELVLYFNDSLSTDITFATAMISGVITASDLNSLKTQFGAGKFLIFKDLNLQEVMALHNLNPKDDGFIADLQVLLQTLTGASKHVEIFNYSLTPTGGENTSIVVLSELYDKLGDNKAENLTFYFSPFLSENNYLENAATGFYEKEGFKSDDLMMTLPNPNSSMIWNYAFLEEEDEEMIAGENSFKLYPFGQNENPEAPPSGLLELVFAAGFNASESDRGLFSGFLSQDVEFNGDDKTIFGTGFLTAACDNFQGGSTSCLPGIVIMDNSDGTPTLTSISEFGSEVAFQRYFMGMGIGGIEEADVLLRRVDTGDWYTVANIVIKNKDNDNSTVTLLVEANVGYLDFSSATDTDVEPVHIAVPLDITGLKAVGDTKKFSFIHYDTTNFANYGLEEITSSIIGYLPEVSIGEHEFADVYVVREIQSYTALMLAEGQLTPNEDFPGTFSESVKFYAKEEGIMVWFDTDVYSGCKEEENGQQCTWTTNRDNSIFIRHNIIR